MSVFHHFLKIFLVLSLYMLDQDPYRLSLDPDPYQSSPWIRIRNNFSHPGSGSLSKCYGSGFSYFFIRNRIQGNDRYGFHGSGSATLSLTDRFPLFFSEKLINKTSRIRCQPSISAPAKKSSTWKLNKRIHILAKDNLKKYETLASPQDRV